MTPPRTPRDVLGVAPDDGPEEIRRAYRRLVLECHPDRNPSAEAAARFAEVSGAYRTLRVDAAPGTVAGSPGTDAGTRPPADPPILSWRNVESNLHFCLRGLGRFVRKATEPKGKRKP